MTETYKTLIEDAAAKLSLARNLLSAEIRSYPTPIAGCDLQYTHLISERERVTAAIKALGEHPFVATPRALTPPPVVETH